MQYFKIDWYRIETLRILLNVDGVLTLSLIKGSPHYYLIEGLIKNDQSKIEIYKKYSLSINPSFDYLEKKKKVLHLIDSYLNGDEFVILIQLTLHNYISNYYRILDGAHRSAIACYFNEEKIKAAVYFYSLQNNDDLRI